MNSFLLKWLFHNGNPIIKYLIAMRYNQKNNMRELKQLILNSESVRYWIHNVLNVKDTLKIHDSFDECFENAMGKLLLFGITDKINEIKPVLNYLLEKLKQFVLKKEKIFKHNWCDANIIAAYLANSGYHNHDIIKCYIKKRLENIDELINRFKFDIYIDKHDFKNIPSSFTGYPLVNPEISSGNISKLPGIFDLLLFRSIINKKSVLCTKQNIKKIHHFIDYVFDPQYQKLPDGYGIQYETGKKYYKVGWNISLPGFFNDLSDERNVKSVVLYAELFSYFPRAAATVWFHNVMKHLESFKTKNETYMFPGEYVQENKNQYFILGGHMGLGENRRKKQWLEIESTYWMLQIKRNIKSVYAAAQF
ncbi:MAG: hypothetical protein JW822_02125 [Spirochaetales bacterium]|nr:hypothetical protein [Spirochaetales bacterium]